MLRNEREREREGEREREQTRATKVGQKIKTMCQVLEVSWGILDAFFSFRCHSRLLAYVCPSLSLCPVVLLTLDIAAVILALSTACMMLVDRSVLFTSLVDRSILFTPFLETVAALLCLGEDDAKLLVSSVIDPLHLFGILIVVKGSQTEPEIVVSQCYQSLYGPIVNLRRPSIDKCMSVVTCFHIGRHSLA